MARWWSSALADRLSSDGVTIKILVVRQPYTYQTFLWDVQINEFVTMPDQKSCRWLLQVLGYQSHQEKLLTFILEKKQQECQRTLGESGKKVNTWMHWNVY